MFSLTAALSGPLPEIRPQRLYVTSVASRVTRGTDALRSRGRVRADRVLPIRRVTQLHHQHHINRHYISQLSISRHCFHRLLLLHLHRLREPGHQFHEVEANRVQD